MALFTWTRAANARQLTNGLNSSLAASTLRSRHLSSLTESKSDDDAAKPKKKEPKKQLTKRIEHATSLEKYQIPNEDPEIPKKHVFQQLTRVRQEGAVYTLQQAAEQRYPDSYTKYWKYQAAFDQTGTLEYALRSYENEHTVVFQYPDVTDFFIVGSGLIGSAVAYYGKKKASRCADFVVIDKDPYSTHNCTATCNGLLSSQSKSRDVSRLATLSKEMIRNLRSDVLVTEEEYAQIKYRPVTHLILWPECELDDVLEAVDDQIKDGCHIDSKLPEEIEQTWPWLRVKGSDVHLGTHGNQDEALVDPIGLRNVYRTLAQAHGAHFIQAEALDFNMQYNINVPDVHHLSAGAIVSRITSGEIKSVMFAKTLLCLGHNTAFLEAQAEMVNELRDNIQDLHFLQPKLRLCFLFTSQAAPIINFPVITDTDGTVLLRDDYAGTFKYYLTLEECEKFFEEDNERFMDMDSNEPFVNLYHRGKEFENYFNNVIKQKLVKRIPVMEDAKFLLANSGFESVNTHDANPIISLHPFHHKILLSGGYGKRLMNFAPAAAAALSELMLLDEEETFDVTKFYWDRVLAGRRVEEFHSLVA